MDGDQILYIFAKQLKRAGKLEKNTVVTTVMSNLGLYKALDAEGIGYEKTAVGDRFVYECMNENGLSLGGEQSGHIILCQYASTGDGILTSIMLMEAMLESKQRLSMLSAGMQIYPQVLRSVKVSDKAAVMENGRVQAAVKEAQAQLLRDGRVLLRSSGTESVVRVMAEAAQMQQAEQCVDTIIEAIREEGLA